MDTRVILHVICMRQPATGGSQPLKYPLSPQKFQNSQTYKNKSTTTAKNISHVFQLIPVRWAMRSMRFIVPRRRMRVRSYASFIFSASAVLSRISLPISTDI